MSSRGSYAVNGHVTTNEYMTTHVDSTGGKILKGCSTRRHSLPDYAHTPNSVYIKLKKMVRHYMKCAFMMKKDIHL